MNRGRAYIHGLVSALLWCIIAGSAGCSGPAASSTGTVPAAATSTQVSTPFVLLPGATLAPTLQAPAGTARAGSVPATPIAAALGGPGSVSIPILMYHQVKDLPPTAGLEDLTWTISPAALETQLSYLADKGYVSISLDQMLDGLSGKAALPAKSVVITFDDGWRTQYTNALPMLKKHKQTATFYVVSTYMGYGAYFDWDMTTELKNSGMTIAAHTLDHANLPTLGAAAIDRELRDSKAALEGKLGITVNHFAYPYGAYNDAVVEAVKRAGYRSATTINPVLVKNPVSAYLLPRIRMSYKETLTEFIQKLP